MPAPPDAAGHVLPLIGMIPDMTGIFASLNTSRYICGRKGTVSYMDIDESFVELRQEAWLGAEQRRTTVPAVTANEQRADGRI
jgi:hypothetical protein